MAITGGGSKAAIKSASKPGPAAPAQAPAPAPAPAPGVRPASASASGTNGTNGTSGAARGRLGPQSQTSLSAATATASATATGRGPGAAAAATSSSSSSSSSSSNNHKSNSNNNSNSSKKRKYTNRKDKKRKNDKSDDDSDNNESSENSDSDDGSQASSSNNSSSSASSEEPQPRGGNNGKRNNLRRDTTATTFTWVGPASKEDRHVAYYDALSVKQPSSSSSAAGGAGAAGAGAAGASKKTDFVIHTGSTVLFHSERSLPFVAVVESLFEHKTTREKQVRARWFFRPKDVQETAPQALQPRKFATLPPHELFYSQYFDVNSVKSILKPCNIAFSWHEDTPEAISNAAIADGTGFTCRYRFDAKSGVIVPLARKDVALLAQAASINPLDRPPPALQPANNDGGTTLVRHESTRGSDRKRLMMALTESVTLSGNNDHNSNVDVVVATAGPERANTTPSPNLILQRGIRHISEVVASNNIEVMIQNRQLADTASSSNNDSASKAGSSQTSKPGKRPPGRPPKYPDPPFASLSAVVIANNNNNSKKSNKSTNDNNDNNTKEISNISNTDIHMDKVEDMIAAAIIDASSVLNYSDSSFVVTSTTTTGSVNGSGGRDYRGPSAKMNTELDTPTVSAKESTTAVANDVSASNNKRRNEVVESTDMPVITDGVDKQQSTQKQMRSRNQSKGSSGPASTATTTAVVVASSVSDRAPHSHTSDYSSDPMFPFLRISIRDKKYPKEGINYQIDDADIPVCRPFDYGNSDKTDPRDDLDDRLGANDSEGETPGGAAYSEVDDTSILWSPLEYSAASCDALLLEKYLNAAWQVVHALKTLKLLGLENNTSKNNGSKRLRTERLNTSDLAVNGSVVLVRPHCVDILLETFHNSAYEIEDALDRIEALSDTLLVHWSADEQSRVMSAFMRDGDKMPSLIASVPQKDPKDVLDYFFRFIYSAVQLEEVDYVRIHENHLQLMASTSSFNNQSHNDDDDEEEEQEKELNQPRRYSTRKTALAANFSNYNNNNNNHRYSDFVYDDDDDDEDDDEDSSNDDGVDSDDEDRVDDDDDEEENENGEFDDNGENRNRNYLAEVDEEAEGNEKPADIRNSTATNQRTAAAFLMKLRASLDDVAFTEVMNSLICYQKHTLSPAELLVRFRSICYTGTGNGSSQETAPSSSATTTDDSEVLVASASSQNKGLKDALFRDFMMFFPEAIRDTLS